MNHTLREIEQQLLNYKKVGCAIALLNSALDNSFLYSGFRNKTDLINENTRFQIASLSKPVTAWAIMKLVEDGRIDLDINVNNYLKNYQFPDDLSPYITTRQLLSHTAGLNKKFYFGNRLQNTSPYSLAQSVKKHTRIVAKPGGRFIYSGSAYTVLQMIIEDVSNMSFEDYMQLNIFNILGMKNSSYSYDLKQKDLYCKGHLTPYIKLPNIQYTEMAAAGLSSTIRDYSTFIKANLKPYLKEDTTEHILTLESIQLMHGRIQRDISYGLGFGIQNIMGHKFIYHVGVNIGWRSFFAMETDRQEGILIFINEFFSNNLMKVVLRIWLENTFQMTADTSVLKRFLN